MKPICASYRKGEELKRFLSYEDDISLLIHVIAYDKDVHHYKLLPPPLCFISKLPINSRLLINRRIIMILGLLSLLFVTMAAIFGKTVLLIVVVALSIMLIYTFIQLYFIDVGKVRVFEVAFNNKTYWNLENMDVNNLTNRVQEIHHQPEKELENARRFRVPIFSEVVLIIKYSIKLAKRARVIRHYMNKSGISKSIPDRLQKQISVRLKEITDVLKHYNLELFDYIVI